MYNIHIVLSFIWYETGVYKQIMLNIALICKNIYFDFPVIDGPDIYEIYKNKDYNCIKDIICNI